MKTYSIVVVEATMLNMVGWSTVPISVDECIKAGPFSVVGQYGVQGIKRSTALWSSRYTVLFGYSKIFIIIGRVGRKKRAAVKPDPCCTQFLKNKFRCMNLIISLKEDT